MKREAPRRQVWRRGATVLTLFRAGLLKVKDQTDTSGMACQSVQINTKKRKFQDSDKYVPMDKLDSINSTTPNFLLIT